MDVDEFTKTYEPFKTLLKYLEREGWQINSLEGKAVSVLGKTVVVVRGEIEHDGEKRQVNDILTPSISLTMIKPRPFAARIKKDPS